MTNLFETPDGDDQAITFDSLVGEGKKYRDPDAVAKAVAEKDRFIEQLQSEAAIARQELRSRTNLEDVVNQLKASRTPPSSEIAPTPRQEPVVEPTPTTPDDLDARVARLLAERDAQGNKTKNLETATNGLRERFGADYKQTLKTIVDELGVTESFVNGLAATSPTGFLKLIDSVKAPDDRRPTSPPASRINSVLPVTGGRRNKAYYDELRRADVNKYLEPKVQQQYYKDAMEQGDSFYK